MRLTTLLTALLLAAVPGLASAAEADSTKRIDRRQEHQEDRIDRAKKGGGLSKKEAARLEHNQTKIDKAERRAAADGKMSKKEREHIEKMQDKQSKSIDAQRKDDNRK